MYESQQNFNSAGHKKVYSRKQLTEWIAHQGSLQQKNVLSQSCNINSVKNGVFFLIILQKTFPQEAVSIKSKMKEKPVTEYDYQKNLQLLKKILNEHKLQANLNINQIIKSKNCFDFLSWMKNLHDGQIMIKSQDYYPPLTEKVISPEKNYNLNSGYKTGRDSSSSKSGQKNLSQGKSNRNYSTSKSQNPFYKIKSGKNLVGRNSQQIPVVLNNNRSQVVTHTQNKIKRQMYMSEYDSLDDCNEALYQRSLQESIQSFKNILKKIQDKVSQTQHDGQYHEFVEEINNCIFGRN